MMALEGYCENDRVKCLLPPQVTSSTSPALSRGCWSIAPVPCVNATFWEWRSVVSTRLSHQQTAPLKQMSLKIISFFFYFFKTNFLYLSNSPNSFAVIVCRSQTVDEEVSSGATSSPLDVRFYPESGPGALFDTLDEVSLADPEENSPPAPETRQGECPQSVLFAIDRSLCSQVMCNTLTVNISDVWIMTYPVSWQPSTI